MDKSDTVLKEQGGSGIAELKKLKEFDRFIGEMAEKKAISDEGMRTLKRIVRHANSLLAEHEQEEEKRRKEREKKKYGGA